ncbi:MAG: 30S ribosomal protein S8 [Candidatus Portnoybacteria bacterium RBG_19FT_COMBO_36_7]|uniref:Small ribosomal subunit protein uS8 n=1 Tax=Candidatus Portnoybacteria bacterium RBG_19FT_COMBO_36_7 TaxID=1801992 RepID=A0A1G2F7Y9_9BACT|nr:MAG: 30S ribosomal protein S8 [Candidatus Portnoybacteria bacterium RBG_19FT_COMBO_36_7]
MLIRIKNAQASGKANVEIPYSGVKLELAKIFERENFVGMIEEKGKKAARKIIISLRYEEGQPAIENIIRKSKPSRRIYIGKKEIQTTRQGFGRLIISTSKGLMSGSEAKKAGLGGELICEIY